MILDGKTLAKNIKENLKKEVPSLIKTLGFTPKLATILVGEDASSKVYVAMKKRACLEVGLGFELIHLSEKTTTEELLLKINELNNEHDVCGILLQHPVPKHIDEVTCFNAILEEKDVDGVTMANFSKLVMKQSAFVSATPLGILMLLKHYNINVEGKHALVVGRSQILGKPIASILLNENATVTIAHSKTTNLDELLKQADIVVACVGKPHFIKASKLKQGVIIIDAGYNSGNIGDVDLENVEQVASYYTPVPGGVGPMTIAALLTQTIESAQKLIKLL